MEITLVKQGDVAVATVRGRMDAVTAPDFENGFDKFMLAGDKRFVVDLGGLEYISSAGLRSILSTAKKLKAEGGKMVFANLGGMVKEVFEISGFCSMFDIYDAVGPACENI